MTENKGSMIRQQKQAPASLVLAELADRGKISKNYTIILLRIAKSFLYLCQQNVKEHS